MNFNYLQEFVTLAEIGKYHEAADTLFISQSSLSKHIQALERELGVPLFTRTTHRVILTEYGAALLPHASKMLEQDLHIKKDFQRLQRQSLKPVIVIGSSPAIPLYQMTNRISSFVKKQPCVVKILNHRASHLKDMVSHGFADFIILYDNGTMPEDEFTAIPYTSDCLAAVLPTGHKLARQHFVSLKELEGEIFIQTGKDPLQDTFLPQSRSIPDAFHLEIGFQTETVAQMLDMVSKGLGISLLGAQSVKHFGSSGIAVVPITPLIPLQVQLYYAKNIQPSRCTEELLSCLREAPRCGD